MDHTSTAGQFAHKSTCFIYEKKEIDCGSEIVVL